MSIRIVALDGATGSGKDTTADVLVRDFGFTKVAFADPLKRIVMDVYGWDIATLWGPSHLRNIPDERYRRHNGTGEGPEFLTPRYAIRELGEAMKGCWRSTWANRLCNDVRKLLDPGMGWSWNYVQWKGLVREHELEREHRIVVPDCRFLIERGALLQFGREVTFWRVDRAGAGEGETHVSETERLSLRESDFGAVLENNSTVAELESLVRATARSVGI